MPVKTVLGLIIANLVWSGNPTAGKILLQEVSPVQGTWLRYSSALLALVLCQRIFGAYLVPAKSPAPRSAFRGADLFYLILMGLAAFCFGPILQLTGLSASHATENALIVSIEPLLTVLLAWIFLREKLHLLVLVSLAIALVGFGMLTGVDSARLAQGWDPHFIGNVIMLISLLGEATYSILGSRLVRRHPPTEVFKQSLCYGVLALTAVTLFWTGLPSLSHLTGSAVLAILWLGPLGTTATYLFWITVLVRAPVSTVALTLFVQPVAGAIWGFCFLGERLTAVQMAGGMLILLAVLGQSALESQSRHLSDPEPALDEA